MKRIYFTILFISYSFMFAEDIYQWGVAYATHCVPLYAIYTPWDITEQLSEVELNIYRLSDYNSNLDGYYYYKLMRGCTAYFMPYTNMTSTNNMFHNDPITPIDVNSIFDYHYIRIDFYAVTSGGSENCLIIGAAQGESYQSELSDSFIDLLVKDVATLQTSQAYQDFTFIPHDINGNDTLRYVNVTESQQLYSIIIDMYKLDHTKYVTNAYSFCIINMSLTKDVIVTDITVSGVY